MSDLHRYCSSWNVGSDGDGVAKAAEKLVQKHLEEFIKALYVELAWNGDKLVANLRDKDDHLLHSLRIAKRVWNRNVIAVPGTSGYVPVKPPQS